MSNMTKLGFTTFTITGEIYSSWMIDVERHLAVINLERTLKEDNERSHQDHSNAVYSFSTISMKDFKQSNLW